LAIQRVMRLYPEMSANMSTARSGNAHGGFGGASPPRSDSTCRRGRRQRHGGTHRV
jgi:hypothetical protein